MNEDPYSKREQDHFFGELFKRMDKQDVTLFRIEQQTLKTNGRVTKLEDWSTGAKSIIEGNTVVSMDYEKSKVRMYTALGLLIFFGGTIVTLGIIVIKNLIHDEVKSSFSVIEKKYDIQVDNDP